MSSELFLTPKGSGASAAFASATSIGSPLQVCAPPYLAWGPTQLVLNDTGRIRDFAALDI